MPQVNHEKLQKISAALLRAGGCDADEAKLVADNLVEANLKGHDSHGLTNLPGYVRRLIKGETVPNQKARVVKDDGPFLVIDGGRGLGQSVTRQAMALAIEKTRVHGVAITGVRNSCHMGRIGHYGEQCAKAGFASLHFVNVSGHPAYVAPSAAREPRFSTNPFCFAVPAAARNPAVILDCATSQVAWGKLKVAFNKREQVADGLLLDPNGKPTRDPSVMVPDPLGAMVVFGGHKGSGIALMCDLLGAALTGGDTIQPGNARDGVAINNMLSIVIDPTRLTDRNRIVSEFDAMIDYVRSAAPLDPDQPVMVAGDPERRAMAQRLKSGIVVDDQTWHDMAAVGRELGLDPRQWN